MTLILVSAPADEVDLWLWGGQVTGLTLHNVIDQSGNLSASNSQFGSAKVLGLTVTVGQ